MHKALACLRDTNALLVDVASEAGKQGAPPQTLAKLFLARAGIEYVRAWLLLMIAEEGEKCANS